MDVANLQKQIAELTKAAEQNKKNKDQAQAPPPVIVEVPMSRGSFRGGRGSRGGFWRGGRGRGRW